MNIEVSRSFSRKIQLRKFEDYVEFFCAAKMGVEVPDLDGREETQKERKQLLEKASKYLDEFCMSEVAKSRAVLQPPLVSADPKATKTKIKDVAQEVAELETNTDWP